MENLKKALAQLDPEQTKHVLTYSKEDFKHYTKVLENLRTAGYLHIYEIPGLKTRSIYLMDQEIRFIYFGTLVILAEEKKELLQKENVIIYKTEDFKTNIFDDDGNYDCLLF